MIKLTQEEQYKHDTRKYCFICKKPFSKDNNDEEDKYKKKSKRSL